MHNEKVYVVAPDHYGVAAMWRSAKYEVVNNADDADIICFTGGEDINPDLYKAPKHPRTSFNPRRDDMEVPFYSPTPEKLKVGICRGAQLLCALNGGQLFQDVDNHHGGHAVLYKTEDGTVEEGWVTSVHHQMMCPNPHSHYEDWAVAAISSYRDLHSASSRKVNYEKDGYDREIVYFPDTASYCFQGHPEFDTVGGRCFTLFHRSIRRALERQAREKTMFIRMQEMKKRRAEQESAGIPQGLINQFVAYSNEGLFERPHWVDEAFPAAVPVIGDAGREEEGQN